jgi:hypothetical protein
VVVGTWMVFELLDELLELLALLELLGVLEGVLDEEAPELADVLLPDVLLVEEVPEVFTVACVDPGRTATTTPATTTLAKDTVTVVVFRRRRPCSRSATACASLREAA